MVAIGWHAWFSIYANLVIPSLFYATISRRSPWCAVIRAGSQRKRSPGPSNEAIDTLGSWHHRDIAHPLAPPASGEWWWPLYRSIQGRAADRTVPYGSNPSDCAPGRMVRRPVRFENPFQVSRRGAIRGPERSNPSTAGGRVRLACGTEI